MDVLPQTLPSRRRRPAVEVVVPSLGGESISEGTLMEWRKQVGEAVAKDEVIAVIETDKAPARGCREAQAALEVWDVHARALYRGIEDVLRRS